MTDRPQSAPDRLLRCARCDWRGDGQAAQEHAREADHPRCIVCQRRSLTEHETQTCTRCVSDVRDGLDVIAAVYTQLPTVVEASGYHTGSLPGGDALVMLADGSMDSPQTPNQYTQPRDVQPTVHVEHAAMGEHPAWVEERAPSSGREHVADHWITDPMSVLAVLEANERDWRRTFGHHPAEDVATVTGSADYLRTWNSVAARTHPAYDEFAAEIQTLRYRLELVAGQIDFPRRDPAPCGCGGKLVQEYGPTGLDDERRCESCGTVYPASDYAWHLRLLTDTPGWVSVQQAAATIGRPVVTIKAWVARLDLPAACNRLTRRMLVDEERAKELAEERPTRRRSA